MKTLAEKIEDKRAVYACAPDGEYERGHHHAMGDCLEIIESLLTLNSQMAGALKRASKCEFSRYYEGGDMGYIAGDDDAEYAVKQALTAYHNAGFGDTNGK